MSCKHTPTISSYLFARDTRKERQAFSHLCRCKKCGAYIELSPKDRKVYAIIKLMEAFYILVVGMWGTITRHSGISLHSVWLLLAFGLLFIILGETVIYKTARFKSALVNSSFEDKTQPEPTQARTPLEFETAYNIILSEIAEKHPVTMVGYRPNSTSVQMHTGVPHFLYKHEELDQLIQPQKRLNYARLKVTGRITNSSEQNRVYRRATGSSKN